MFSEKIYKILWINNDIEWFFFIIEFIYEEIWIYLARNKGTWTIAIVIITIHVSSFFLLQDG